MWMSELFEVLLFSCRSKLIQNTTLESNTNLIHNTLKVLLTKLYTERSVQHGLNFQLLLFLGINFSRFCQI